MKSGKMGVCVLLSCMHQKDDSIVERTNIQTDVVIVNQCDEDSQTERCFKNRKGRKCHVMFINTTERGLSRSRNLAIRHATQPICLLCDDDEFLETDYEEKIQQAYLDNAGMGCILFMINRNDLPTPKVYPATARRVGFKQMMQSSSVQITFLHEKIKHYGILFDTMLGSGTGNGAGEENKFLLDIKRKKIGVYYVPQTIGTVLPGNSLWFNGLTDKYMRNQGWSSRRFLGNVKGMFYILFFWFRHIDMIKKEMPVLKGLKCLMQGFFETRVEKD